MIGLLTNPHVATLVAKLAPALEAGRAKVTMLAAMGVIGPAAIPQVADTLRSAFEGWNPEVRGVRILRHEAREHFLLGIADLLIQVTLAQGVRDV